MIRRDRRHRPFFAQNDQAIQDPRPVGGVDRAVVDRSRGDDAQLRQPLRIQVAHVGTLGQHPRFQRFRWRVAQPQRRIRAAMPEGAGERGEADHRRAPAESRVHVGTHRPHRRRDAVQRLGAVHGRAPDHDLRARWPAIAIPHEVIEHRAFAHVAVAGHCHVEVAAVGIGHARERAVRTGRLRGGADRIDAVVQPRLRGVIERMRVVVVVAVVALDLRFTRASPRGIEHGGKFHREAAAGVAPRPRHRLDVHAADAQATIACRLQQEGRQRLRLARAEPQLARGVDDIVSGGDTLREAPFQFERGVDRRLEHDAAEAAALDQPLHQLDLDLQRASAAMVRVLAEQDDVPAADIADETVEFGGGAAVERRRRLRFGRGGRAQPQQRPQPETRDAHDVHRNRHARSAASGNRAHIVASTSRHRRRLRCGASKRRK